MFWALQFKPSRQKIVATLLIGALSLTTLQTMKYAYRQQVWNGYSGSKIELFTRLSCRCYFIRWRRPRAADGELNNVRLNQGWIISAILDEVPEKQTLF